MRALVVIPTYNELATLERAVRRVLEADQRCSVLVVDDASPDGTGALADRLAAELPRVTTLHRSGKNGLGSAYREGFAIGLAQGFDVCVEMDADLSHPATALPRLLDALDTAEVSIGSRYVAGGEVEGWPLSRLLLSRGGNAYVRAWTGVPVKDATAGYRAYRREVLEEMDLATVVSEGYSFQLEMTLRAWVAGARITEVPITFTERAEGSSKMSRSIVAEALWRVAGWGWQIRRGAPVGRVPVSTS